MILVKSNKKHTDQISIKYFAKISGGFYSDFLLPTDRDILKVWNGFWSYMHISIGILVFFWWKSLAYSLRFKKSEFFLFCNLALIDLCYEDIHSGWASIKDSFNKTERMSLFTSKTWNSDIMMEVLKLNSSCEESRNALWIRGWNQVPISYSVANHVESPLNFLRIKTCMCDITKL